MQLTTEKQFQIMRDNGRTKCAWLSLSVTLLISLLYSSWKPTFLKCTWPMKTIFFCKPRKNFIRMVGWVNVVIHRWMHHWLSALISPNSMEYLFGFFSVVSFPCINSATYFIYTIRMQDNIFYGHDNLNYFTTKMALAKFFNSTNAVFLGCLTVA